MQSTNRKHGYVYTGDCVLKPGNYFGYLKVTIILTIDPGNTRLPPSGYGSVEWSRRWVKADPVPRTTTEDSDDFLTEICKDLLHNPSISQEDEHHVFLWDNLGSHAIPIIHQTVEADYSRLIQLAGRLRNRCHRIKDLPQLVKTINVLLVSWVVFDVALEHVGYESNQYIYWFFT